MFVEEYDFQIIANFLAGKRKAAKELENLKKFLDENQKSYQVLIIDKPRRISEFVKDEKIKIKRGIICIGGDGSVSETVSYMIKQKIDVPLAVIPVGTANIIASSLGLKNRFHSYVFLLKEKIMEVDIGVADYGRKKDYFLLGVGLGFEENFLKKTSEDFKLKFGTLSYILMALKDLLSLKKVPVRIVFKKNEINLNVCLLTILNLQPKILGLFPLFIDKEIKKDDGLFNLYYIEYRNYFYALLGTIIFHFWGGQGFGFVKALKTEELSLTSPELCPTQIDGEQGDCLPLNIYFHSRKCRFFI